MRTLSTRSCRPRLSTSVGVALAATFMLAIPAVGFDNGWTKPKRVFSHASAPTHSMVTDGSSRVHLATERGSGGIWYVTNAGGSWSSCRVSDGNDRQPSIAVAGGVVHVAWTRQSEGSKGVYTSSSDQSGPAGCGWKASLRFAGGASHSALGVYGDKLSIAFRTPDRKLRFLKGDATDPSWDKPEVIDGTCCTSPVTLDLTVSGAPRVAYGDGTSSAQGLKFATRTAKGWNKSRAYGGRIKGVDMVLDKTPPLFGGPPSDGPLIVFVVKGKGLFLATKGGGWSVRGLGNASGTPQIQHHSNLTQVVYTQRGNLKYLRASGGIWAGSKLSGAGTDLKPQLHGGKLTFSRKAGTKGIFFSQPK